MIMIMKIVIMGNEILMIINYYDNSNNDKDNDNSNNGNNTDI